MARQVVVDIVGSADKYTKATNDAIKASGGLQGKLQALDKQFTTMTQKGGITGSILGGVGIGAGIGIFNTVTKGIGMVTDYLGDSIRAAQQETAAIAKMTTAIKENDRAWDGNVDAIEAVIAARQRDFVFADGDQREAISRLVAVTKDYNAALDLERQAMDLARLKGMSLVDASELLGKVYSGNVGILSRYGIQLRKGASASEALAEIQKRSAGQAETYGKSSAGAAERLDQSLGDLSETIGHLIEGPAADLAGFLNGLVTSLMPDHNSAMQKATDYVNAYGKAVSETVKTGEELAAQLKDQEIRAYADAWRMWLETNSDFGNIVGDNGRALQWLRGVNVDYARTTGWTIEALAALAAKISTTGGTLTDFQLAVSGLQASNIDLRRMAMRYVHSFDEMGGAATRAGRGLWAGFTIPTKDAVHGALRTLTSALDPWKKAWREMAAWAKDPFKPDKFEDYIDGRVKAALRKARKAEEDHMPGAARRWRRIARLMQDPVFKALINIGVGVDDALADIALVKAAGKGLAQASLGWFDVFGNDNDGGKKGNKGKGGKDGKGDKPKDNRPPDGPSTGKNARGTSNWRGGRTWVGEEGPEIADLPPGTRIYPHRQSMAMAGGTTVVNVNVNVPPTADAASVGREVVRALRAWSRIDGGVGIRAAMSATG